MNFEYEVLVDFDGASIPDANEHLKQLSYPAGRVLLMSEESAEELNMGLLVVLGIVKPLGKVI